jgi:hypothetical protein
MSKFLLGLIKRTLVQNFPTFAKLKRDKISAGRCAIRVSIGYCACVTKKKARKVLCIYCNKCTSSLVSKWNFMNKRRCEIKILKRFVLNTRILVAKVFVTKFWLYSEFVFHFAAMTDYQKKWCGF